MSSGAAAEPPADVAWARWFWPTAIAVLVLDQATKWWLFALLASARLPSWIQRAENKGVAWSVGDRAPGLVALATAVLIPVLAWVWWTRFRRLGPFENLAFGLILGGAIGNAFDRAAAVLHLFGLSGVRDFIYVDLGFWPAHPWPTFNIADSGITIGFLVLVALTFRKPRAAPHVGIAAVPDR